MRPALLLEGAAGAAAGAARIAWPEFYDGWHEFYLMAGTAAVTLAGLLFVAISLHIDALIDDSRAYLLGLARTVLLSFVMVLTLSLVMLIPHQSLRMTGVLLSALGVVAFAVTTRQARAGAASTHHDEFSRALFRRRQMIPLFGYGWLVLTGVAVLVTGVPEFTYWAVGAVCMLLGNAAGTSWDLLVRVARVKAADAKARAPRE